MQCKRRRQRFWWSVAGTTVLAAAIAVSLVVLAGGDDGRFTATSYADVIRFEAEGVATLQVRIFDLSGRGLWDSGVVSGWSVDWDRRNEFGERLAYGAYIYSAQGWNASGDLNFQKNGKLALMPGEKVQLQAAPVTPSEKEAPLLLTDLDSPLQPKMQDINDDLTVHGNMTVQGHGTIAQLNPGSTSCSMHIQGGTHDNDGSYLNFYGDDHPHAPGWVHVGYGSFDELSSNAHFQIEFAENTTRTPVFRIQANGNVGIGTISPAAKLEIESSAGQNLIAAYNSTNRVFVVKNNGEVRADGAYYGASYNTGNADVAERINTSEWVDAGCVVEIDPEHPGFFRKSTSPYSKMVAGIISTSPGVILGNSFDEATDEWEDNRPVLAIAGRVPLQVTVENGPIQIGDLLVSSSTPGVAMRGDPAACMGSVIGKAMEPLENGTETIVVQVMLR